jgi:hypothetical protein
MKLLVMQLSRNGKTYQYVSWPLEFPSPSQPSAAALQVQVVSVILKFVLLFLGFIIP